MTVTTPGRRGDAEPRPRVRFDWRDTLSNAADLALLGIVTTLAALPVVTAGAALANASAAVHDWLPGQRMPAVRTTFRRFVRAVPGGFVAFAVAALVGYLLTWNVVAIRRGTVPGGTPLVMAALAVAVVFAGLAMLILVQVGRQGGTGWWPATRVAARTAWDNPVSAVATGGVLGLAVFLCVMLPICIPIVVGFVIFAAHVVVATLVPAPDDA